MPRYILYMYMNVTTVGLRNGKPGYCIIKVSISPVVLLELQVGDEGLI